ncbi:MAG: SIMPL domain-containing protein [Proteobacteria bacterium]|nr:SIMPL domain-containing protein [Pseudomonadota bacterium]
MSTRLSTFLRGGAALAAPAILLALFAAPIALKADAGAAATPRLVTVSGEGDVKATPDQATLSAGVVTQEKTAADALASNARAMNEVFATLKKLGIPDHAIQTSNFSVQPQYEPYDANRTQPPRIVGYQVSNTVNVRVDDLKKLGPSLDALVAAGSNQLGGVAFSIKNPKPLLAQAREDAVKDAIERAQTYAHAAGITLGPIVSIQEGGAEPPPRPVYAMAMKQGADSTPVAPGEESVSASVTISWQIK